MAQIEQLIRRRGGVKGRITRIFNWVEQNFNLVNNVFEFEVRERSLTQAFEQFQENEVKIEEIDASQVDTEDTENRYFSCLALIKSKVSSLSSLKGVSTQQQASIISTTNVNLPQLNIPQFNGDITKWNAFYQLYDSLILQNESLSNIQKLVYLRSYLEKEPLHLIENLQLTDTNLDIAVNTLKQRYDNQLSIIFSHIKNLVEIPQLTKLNSQNLRQFIVCIRQNIESLRNQNIPVDFWDLILIYIFSNKLDFNTKKSYISERSAQMTGTQALTLPKLEEFLAFLEKRCSVLENLNESASSNSIFNPNSRYKQSHCAQGRQESANMSSLGFNNPPQNSRSNNTQQLDRSINKDCIYCNTSGHRIYNCYVFRKLSLKSKNEFVSEKGLCFNCLGSKHKAMHCTSKKCSLCSRKHHTLLHPVATENSSSNPINVSGQNSPRDLSHNCSRTSQERSNIPDQSQSNENPNSRNPTSENSNQSSHTSLSTFANDKNEVLLATALINLRNSQGNIIAARAIIDPGSTISIVTDSLIKRLNLRPSNQHIQICGIGGNIEHTNKVISLQIQFPQKHDFDLTVNCCILDKITRVTPPFKIDKSRLNIPCNVVLADPDFDKPAHVDVLLGADVYYKILLGNMIKLNEQSLTLVQTRFGYIISGLVPFDAFVSHSSRFQDCFLLQNFSVEKPLTSLLERFWSLDDYTHCKEKQLTPKDLLVEKHFRETTINLKNGSFQIDLPLKEPKQNFLLGDSFFLAKKRFEHLENRFKRNPELFVDYKRFIDEYILLNHAKYVPLSLTNANNEIRYFLPHHCVIREESKSTKLRVVFDGSMKTSSGLSLNDILHKGYTVQPELYDILLRFRSFKFVITTDIEKMFRQVRVNPNHTYLQNIVWRENPSEELKCIELLTVTYGTNCAPFLATRVLKELAEIHKNTFPLGSEAILSQCYVDDILSGHDTYEGLVQLYEELTRLCKKGNFNLHKWCSNSFSFLKTINSQGNVHSQDSHILHEEGMSNKVLGILWYSSKDMFSISIPPLAYQDAITKSNVLSMIAQMYDPLGLIGPIIVVAKIIMQEIWKSKIDWNDCLSSSLQSQWTTFIERIPQLQSLQIPRFILSDNNFESIELHGFCDASQRAYGACIYVRALYSDGSVSCHLLTSKSRVAPIKSITIPRLELCGALLLSKLVSHVKLAFQERFSFESVNLWTDSRVVLAWLNSCSSQFNVFVANRIADIQNLTEGSKWYHIPSSLNPADCLSRGLTSSELMNSKLWWNGPKFLLDPKIRLDTFKFNVSNTEEERKISKPVLLAQTDDFWQLFFEKFSSYVRLQRTVSYVLRFVNNIKPKKPKFNGRLSVTELQESELFIFKVVQGQTFSQELRNLKQKTSTISNKQILKLNPFVDDSGMIRVGGRLAQADVSVDQKFPILLPSKNHVVQLFLKKEHYRLRHTGSQTILSNIRLRYWPLNGLRELKRIAIDCNKCYKFKAKNFQQIMADLPKDRIIPSRPFQKTGVDFAGPIIIKSSNLRKAKIEKAYISIFICMVTKAAHIELVSSLSTAAFLACLQRFIARRGCPSIIFSDNGTNFFGASNQLKELYDLISEKETNVGLHYFATQNEIEWKFIPPHSPHWGGLWEAAVKNCKYHLKRIVANQNFTFEELCTILVQIEAILNSRPLQPLSSDPLDFSCLTPGHFLIGCPLMSYPERDISDMSINRLDRWSRVIQVKQNFWKHWTKDYLNHLQNRPKWLLPKRDIKLNEVVLLKEDNTNPLDWPLARVLEVLPGRDGRVRVVKLQTKKGVFTRSIAKLCPLPGCDQ